MTGAADAPRSDEARPGPSGAPVIDGTPSTMAQLQRFGRAYPAIGRAAVSVVCLATAPFTDPPAGTGILMLVAVGALAWNAALLAMLLPRGHDRRPYGWAYGVDVVLKCLLCLGQPLLVNPALLAEGLGWVAPIASFTVVAVQFTLRPLPAAVATAAICGTFVTGVAASSGLTVRDGLPAGAWMAVVALLARLLWQLLVRGAREADLVLQARLRTERDAATAAARRAGRRAHWATVHDTSASTLLMIGLGQVTGSERWLPGQVRRDIDLLDGRREPGDGAVDLGARVRTAVEHARVRVELDGPDEVVVPAAVAEAMSGALAEALENVHRHAGTGAATVTLRSTTEGPGQRIEVAVTDAGRGFDPSAVGPRRFGLARSVHDRMRDAGGTAEVESAPGRGTVVRLRWTPAVVPVVGAPEAGDADVGDEAFLARALLRGLRVGRSVIVLTILLGLALPHVVARLDVYASPWTAFAWLAALVAVAVADAVLVARDRSWGRARWPVAVAVLAVSVWASQLLPADALVGPAHRVVGLVGWIGVLLFGDAGIRPLLGLLAAHVGLLLLQLGAAGRLDTPTLLNLAVLIAVSAGFQLTAGAAATSLNRVAATATETARRQAAALTAEAVAQQSHADREERYARLRASVLPLLRGVEEGSLSPADPDVQRRAAVEAARMRRLFAGEGDAHDPLAAELGALVEVVERRGTDVRFSTRGQRPVPPAPVRRAMVEEVGAALLASRGSARVTLGPVGTGVVVSVVTEGAAASRPPGGAGCGDITTVTVADGERTWVQARWSPDS